MRRRFGARLRKLDQQLHPHDPPGARLVFLIPDLWPEADQAASYSARSQEERGDLIARRTGIRPTCGGHRIWSITVPVPDALLAMSDAEKAAFMERHESRPRQPEG